MVDLNSRPFVTSPIGGRPRGLRIERSDARLRIGYASRSFESVSLAIIAAAMLALSAWGIAAGGFGGSMVGALAFLPTALLCYVALAGLVNEVVLDVTTGLVVISRRPIPWPRGRHIPAGQILQLYVEHRGVGARWGPVARVVAVMEDARRVAVTGYLVGERAGWAPYIEKELERHLGIVNRPIACARCGYDLRATNKRCPECGERFRWGKRLRRAWRARPRRP